VKRWNQSARPKPLVPGAPTHDPALSRFVVYWETHDTPVRHWQCFATRDEAVACIRMLRNQGGWVCERNGTKAPRVSDYG
jgi:hypothetical protein